MVSAKQKAARAAFAYRMKHGGFRKIGSLKRAKRSYSRVSKMARHKFKRGKNKSFGMGGLIKPVAIGLGTAILDAGEMVPVVKDINGFENAITAAGAEFILDGFKFNVKKMAIAAGTAHFSPILVGKQAGDKLSW